MPPSLMKKVRLDCLLVERGLVESREKAKALIMEGKVLVDNNIIHKVGKPVHSNAEIRLTQKIPYVSRGGLKLEAALKDFHIETENKTAMDVGASTGGFTDCLIQHGIKKVYAIDVGYGQLAWTIRKNPKVIPIERTNIRYISKHVIQDTIDIATIDVSFISLLKVIPKVSEFLASDGEIIALIKPQFEVKKKDVEKGGVVKDEEKRQEIIRNIISATEKMGFAVKGIIKSPLLGPKGNVEFLLHLTKHKR
jgi:23S rRNA (cytidine1920-2'-O)/16S rRNA (cytidine1409-2'-O)-methyltransferase